MSSLSVAVSGLNASDNPAPGVAVIRSIREANPGCRIIGLSYDPLDSGNYIHGLVDHVFLFPYPSQGIEVAKERLLSINSRVPIDVIVPTLDAELSLFVKLGPVLHREGIRSYLPLEEQLDLRSKERFGELQQNLGIRIPKSVPLVDRGQIAKLHDDLDFPVVVKGQFYEAYPAYSTMEVETLFHRIRAKWGLPVIAQEFISGQEYDVAVVGNGQGDTIGSVAMRKMQLTEKGKAWGGVTISNPQLQAFVEDAVSKLKWRGPCEMEVISSKDDELYMIEINPRFPAWIYLSVGASRNLPDAVLQLALGQEVEPMPPSDAGIMFLRYAYDQICMLSDYNSLTTFGELFRNEKM